MLICSGNSPNGTTVGADGEKEKQGLSDAELYRKTAAHSRLAVFPKQGHGQRNCIEGNDWVKNCFDKIRADIEKYKLGRNWLYDNAKYFHRGFERYREEKWEDTPKLFELINHDNPVRTALGQEKIDIGSYIDEYYFYYLDGNMTFEEPPISPINYVEQVANISSGPELEVCRWILDVVHNVTVIIHNRDLTEHDDTLRNNFTDAIPETFEDKYYEALLWIYYTYNSAPQSDGEISKRRKKKSRKQK